MRKLALASWGLSVALAPLNSTMAAVAVPAMSRDLDAQIPLVTSLAVAAYLVGNVVLSAPAGRLGEVIGFRRAQRIGLLLFLAASVLGSFVHTLWAIGAARVVMAAGASMLVPAAMATVRVEIPAAERPRFLGAFSALMGISAAIGPLLGGELVGRFGWPSVFWVNAPVVALAGVLSFVGEDRPPVGGRFSVDVVGTLTFAVATVSLVAARNAGEKAVLLGLALVAFAAFVAWEARTEAPAVDVRLFTIPAFRASTVVICFQNVAMYGLLTVMPVLLEREAHATSRDVGRLMLVMTLSMVGGSVLAGRLTRRFGVKKTMLFGTVVGTAGMLSILAVPLAEPAKLAPSLFLLGAGLGLTTPGAQAVALAAVPPDRSGRAAGASSAARYMGGILGVLASSAMVSTGHVSWMVIGFSAVLALTVVATVGIEEGGE